MGKRGVPEKRFKKMVKNPPKYLKQKFVEITITDRSLISSVDKKIQ